VNINAQMRFAFFPKMWSFIGALICRSRGSAPIAVIMSAWRFVSRCGYGRGLVCVIVQGILMPATNAPIHLRQAIRQSGLKLFIAKNVIKKKYYDITTETGKRVTIEEFIVVLQKRKY